MGTAPVSADKEGMKPTAVQYPSSLSIAVSELGRLSGRLCRLAATLATPSARICDGRARLEGQLERLVREIGQLRIDDPTGVARAAWVLAEMEESFRNPPAGAVMMPVYTAN